MSGNAALQNYLLGAAAKAMGTDLSKILSKSAVKKADPKAYYSDYDLSLGQFHVPGVNRPEDPTEEQRMLAGLKFMAQKLKEENEALKGRIRTETESAIKKGFAQGYAKGNADGLAKGKADSQSGITAVQAGVTKIMKSFEARKEEALSKSERKCLELVLKTTEAVIRKECSVSSDVVLNVLKKSIADIARTDFVTVRVNPDELSSVIDSKNFWSPINAQLKELKIEADSRVEKGGCIIETGSGMVDSRISTQLATVRTIFEKAWEEGTK